LVEYLDAAYDGLLEHRYEFVSSPASIETMALPQLGGRSE
jgi:hypothetical protein